MRKFKPISTDAVTRLGNDLKVARTAKKLTLAQAAQASGVDLSQISRFEHGKFKKASENLQIYADYLQIMLPVPNASLGERFKFYAARSEHHRIACEMIIEALEHIR